MKMEQVSKIISMAETFDHTQTKKDFDELSLQIKIFFRKEEEWYEKHNHPDLKIHTKTHKEFERVLFFFDKSFFQEKKCENDISPEKFCLYVKNWTLLHFECYDKIMLPYIRISEFTQERES